MSNATKRAKIASLKDRSYTLLDEAQAEVTTIKAVAPASRTLNQKQDLAAAQRFIVVTKLTLMTLGLERDSDVSGSDG